MPSCSAALAAASAAITVSPSLGSTITSRACAARAASSSWPADGALPGPLVTTTRARLLEHLGQSRPRGAGDHGHGTGAPAGGWRRPGRRSG